MLLDARTAVLFNFGRATSRRTTFGQLRIALNIRRGLAGVLEELRNEGKVHYVLGENSQFYDDTIVALCTTIKLRGDYRLVVLDPDEAGPTDDGSAWQVLVFGTQDPVLASEGFRYYPDEDFSSRLRSLLYGSVSSSVIYKTWSYVEACLKMLRKEYARRHDEFHAR